eukprot:TRINITY_DN0_c506_g1_i1.p3 TRINITY_DN0_c506_g1~~TRINITY_DN0_c506_g1_i1.p3  ORF type:complete len:106 (+),score=50.94 TRINITY_DN0_c506_g1_i1:1-318(+)
MCIRDRCIPFDPAQNFASSSSTRSVVYEICKKADIPVHDYAKKNDQSSGSTLGPGLSAMTSIRTVDLGPALLAMHSIRETGGTQDAFYCYKFAKTFFGQGALNKK